METLLERTLDDFSESHGDQALIEALKRWSKEKLNKDLKLVNRKGAK